MTISPQSYVDVQRKASLPDALDYTPSEPIMRIYTAV